MSARSIVLVAALLESGATLLAPVLAQETAPAPEAGAAQTGAPEAIASGSIAPGVGASEVSAPGAGEARAAAQSLTLEDCFRIAVRRSERIGLAQEDYDQTRLVRRNALSNVLPQVTLQNTYFRQNAVDLPPPTGTSGNAFTFANDRNQLLVKLRQPIFSGFRDQNFLASSSQSIEASRHALAEAQRRLYGDLAAAFYAALQRQGEVDTLEDSVRVESERLREVQARHEVGLARRTEVLLVQAQLAEDESSLTRARNDLEVAREQLAFLMGAPVDRALLDELALPEVIAGAPPPVEEARARRSDMRQREREVEAARYQVAVARGQYYPTLDLEANRFIEQRNYSTFQQETDWSAQINFSFPLFDGGRARANVATAASKLRQATLSRDELARQIELEVESAWLTLQSDVARLKTLGTSVASADESYRLVQEEYRGGLATNLEVITAHNLLLSSRLDLERQKYQVSLDWVAAQIAQGLVPEVPAEGAQEGGTSGGRQGAQ